MSRALWGWWGWQSSAQQGGKPGVCSPSPVPWIIICWPEPHACWGLALGVHLCFSFILSIQEVFILFSLPLMSKSVLPSIWSLNFQVSSFFSCFSSMTWSSHCQSSGQLKLL